MEYHTPGYNFADNNSPEDDHRQIYDHVFKESTLNQDDLDNIQNLLRTSSRNANFRPSPPRLAAFKFPDQRAYGDSRDSLLILAARNGHFTVIPMLLEAGADPNVRNKSDSTALRELCILANSTEDVTRVNEIEALVRALLEAGADPDPQTLSRYSGSRISSFELFQINHQSIYETVSEARKKKNQHELIAFVRNFSLTLLGMFTLCSVIMSASNHGPHSNTDILRARPVLGAVIGLFSLIGSFSAAFSISEASKSYAIQHYRI